ncbi:hypothetical protein ABEF95_000922 [Exophiala dermatitidis]
MDERVTISTETWNKHKDDIRYYYLEHGMSLADVRWHMQYIFGFTASEQQYKRKLTQWRFVKNHKSSTYRMIGHTLNRRRLDPYSAEVRIGNEVLSPQRLRRRLRRHNPPTSQMQNPRSGVACRTSSVRDDPAYQSAGAVNISITRALLNPHALSCEALPGFQLLEKMRSLSLNSLGPLRQPSRLRSITTFSNEGNLRIYPGDRPFTVHATPFLDTNKYHDNHLLVADGFRAESMHAAGYHDPNGPTTNGLLSLMKPSWCFDSSQLRSDNISALFPVHDPDFVLEDLRSVSSMSAPQANIITIGYVIYLCSNGAPEERVFDDFMDQLLQTGIERLLHHFNFVDSNSQPLRRFAEYLLIYAARKGRCDLLEFLHKAGMDLSRPLNVHDQIRTPLQEAIVHRNATFCKRLLIDYGADSNTYLAAAFGRYKESPSDLAARYLPEIFWSIQKRQGPVRDQDFPGAVMAGLTADQIPPWLEQGIDVNALDGRFRTALHNAIEKEDVLLATFLLKQGAKVDGWGYFALEQSLKQRLPTDGDLQLLLRKYSDAPSPWSLAVETGNVELCQALLDAGLEVLSPPMQLFAGVLETLGKDDWHLGNWSFSRTPQGYVSLLEFILSGSRAEISQTLSPLLFAVGAGNRQIVELVLENGADIHQATHDLWVTPLQAASYGGAIDIMSVLVGAGADINTHSALQAAVFGGHLDATKFLLEHGADVNAACAEVFGCTALQAAAYKGDEELVGVLLRAGADPNAPKSKKFGYTALEAAIRGKSHSMFWTLIEEGADPTLTQWHEDPPLSALTQWDGSGTYHSNLVRVATEGRMDLWQRLLELGVNIPSHLTPGYLAFQEALFGYECVLNEYMLASLSTNPAFDPPTVTMVLGLYIMRNPSPKLSIIRQLFDLGAHVDGSRFGVSPLAAASERGEVNVVKLLLELGADVDGNGAEDGLTPLTAACRWGHLDAVQCLLEYGAVVNPSPMGANSSPLHVAAAHGYVRIAQSLLGAGADVGVVWIGSDTSVSALDLAAEWGRLDMVKLLLDNYQLKQGESLPEIIANAAAIARWQRHWVIVKLLENYCRDPAPTSRPPEEDIFATFTHI